MTPGVDLPPDLVGILASLPKRDRRLALLALLAAEVAAAPADQRQGLAFQLHCGLQAAIAGALDAQLHHLAPAGRA